jgi:hypothetical protein
MLVSCLRAFVAHLPWLLILGLSTAPRRSCGQQRAERHSLYVALPDSDADVDRSIRILVFDIANGHRLVSASRCGRPHGR